MFKQPRERFLNNSLTSLINRNPYLFETYVSKIQSTTKALIALLQIDV